MCPSSCYRSRLPQILHSSSCMYVRPLAAPAYSPLRSMQTSAPSVCVSLSRLVHPRSPPRSSCVLRSVVPDRPCAVASLLGATSVAVEVKSLRWPLSVYVPVSCPCDSQNPRPSLRCMPPCVCAPSSLWPFYRAMCCHLFYLSALLVPCALCVFVASPRTGSSGFASCLVFGQRQCPAAK
jgi:hypothetical protein